MWIAGWVVEEKYCSFPASWSFGHTEIWGVCTSGTGVCSEIVSWCIFTSLLYFTEKLLPFLVPGVSIFYATPTPPRLSWSWEIKGMQIDSNWNEGPPCPPCWLIVLLTLHAKTGSTRKSKERGRWGRLLRAWLVPSSSRLIIIFVRRIYC